jgi:hypothetical protein
MFGIIARRLRNGIYSFGFWLMLVACRLFLSFFLLQGEHFVFLHAKIFVGNVFSIYSSFPLEIYRHFDFWTDILSV